VASEHQPGQNANALTDERALDAISGTSVANGIPVDVEAGTALALRPKSV
jgi:hypothetical protein